MTMNKNRLVLGTIFTLASLSMAHAQLITGSFPVAMEISRRQEYGDAEWFGPVGPKHLITVDFQNYSDTAYNVLDWEFALIPQWTSPTLENSGITIKLSTLAGQNEVVGPLQTRRLQMYYNYEALTATGPAYGSFFGVFRLRHEGQLYVSERFSHYISAPKLPPPPPVPEPATALLFMPAVAWVMRKRSKKVF